MFDAQSPAMKTNAAAHPSHHPPEEQADGGAFSAADGVRFAGTHLLVDLWDGHDLDSLVVVEAALREAVQAAGATLLRIDLHHFAPYGGVSGVAILAESHMSIHTWPEEGFAALDIFVCGDCEARRIVPVIQRHFGSVNTRVTELRRGIAP
jgi:S-adenosylmethionine decarboxylase